MRYFSVVALVLSLAVPAPASEKKSGPNEWAKIVAPFLDAQTIGVARMDLTKIDPDALMKKLDETGIKGFEEGSARRKTANQMHADLVKAGGKEIFLVYSLADLTQGPFVVVPMNDGADAKAISGLLTALNWGPDTTSEKKDRVLLVGGKDVLKRLKDLKPVERPEVAKAFAAAGESAAQVLFLPTDDCRRLVRELYPVLPPEAGGGPSKVLTDGLKWAALSMELTPKASLKLTGQSNDARSARALADWTPAFLKAVGQQTSPLGTVAQAASKITPTVAQDRLSLTLDTDNLKK